MENNGTPFIVSIERFKPNWFHLEQGEGLFKSHSHAYDELTLILDGEGYYSSPEQNVKVVAGDLIMIPPGLYHGFVCTEPWQGISVHYYHDHLPVHSRYLFTGSINKGSVFGLLISIMTVFAGQRSVYPNWRRSGGPATSRALTPII
ncbi:cupin domain-containing protein [Paenibacillus sp. USHLN196]|uniref:cupin domain-containing protein n=1 Tax=Paenibacillus sp. USHLN196 TaxID=3081291 RepID=UPI00301599D7